MWGAGWIPPRGIATHIKFHPPAKGTFVFSPLFGSRAPQDVTPLFLRSNDNLIMTPPNLLLAKLIIIMNEKRRANNALKLWVGKTALIFFYDILD